MKSKKHEAINGLLDRAEQAERSAEEHEEHKASHYYWLGVASGLRTAAGIILSDIEA